jgi:hypothetical protein
VLGAMELGYQRGKIQEESLQDKHLKRTGDSLHNARSST